MIDENNKRYWRYWTNDIRHPARELFDLCRSLLEKGLSVAMQQLPDTTRHIMNCDYCRRRGDSDR